MGELQLYLFLQAVEHFAGARNQQHTLLLAALPVFQAHGGRVEIAEVDAPAAFGRDGGGQGDLDARGLDAGDGVVFPQALDVG